MSIEKLGAVRTLEHPVVVSGREDEGREVPQHRQHEGLALGKAKFFRVVWWVHNY